MLRSIYYNKDWGVRVYSGLVTWGTGARAPPPTQNLLGGKEK